MSRKLATFIANLNQNAREFTIPKNVVNHADVSPGDLLRLRIDGEGETIVMAGRQNHTNHDSYSISATFSLKVVEYYELSPGQTIEIEILDKKDYENHDYKSDYYGEKS